MESTICWLWINGIHPFVDSSRNIITGSNNMLTPAEINSWNPLICWLLKIYICHSLINHQFNHQLIKYFDFYTFKSQYKLFMRRYHFLMLKGAIILTINSHYWLQLYQLTFYHLVMEWSTTDGNNESLSAVP